MELDSGTLPVADLPSMDMAELTPATTEDTMNVPVAEDLKSRPLDELGVSVMDQDVLERNVAAQVCHLDS